MVAKRQRDGEELNWEFGISQGKLLWTEWISIKVLFYSTGNSTWYLTCVLVAQLCLTLCDPMGCSLPDSSLCGISQERKHNGKEWKKKKKRQKVSLLPHSFPSFSSSKYLLLILSISSGICLDWYFKITYYTLCLHLSAWGTIYRLCFDLWVTYSLTHHLSPTSKSLTVVYVYCFWWLTLWFYIICSISIYWPINCS